MDINQTILELSNLPITDRVRVVQAIWDSLPGDADLGVSPAQQAELDRRIAAHDADPDSAISRDELQRLLKGDS